MQCFDDHQSVAAVHPCPHHFSRCPPDTHTDPDPAATCIEQVGLVSDSGGQARGHYRGGGIGEGKSVLQAPADVA